jgi:hypothetical protein
MVVRKGRCCIMQPFDEEGQAEWSLEPRISVFLGGCCKMINDEDWREVVTGDLWVFPVTVYNPMRLDWDYSRLEDVAVEDMARQCQWEWRSALSADIIVFCVRLNRVDEPQRSLVEILGPVLTWLDGIGKEQKKLILCWCPSGYLGCSEVIAAGVKVVHHVEEIGVCIVHALMVKETKLDT